MELAEQLAHAGFLNRKRERRAADIADDQFPEPYPKGIDEIAVKGEALGQEHRELRADNQGVEKHREEKRDQRDAF